MKRLSSYKHARDLKRLNSTNSSLAETESGYFGDYENDCGEGYNGAISENGERQLLLGILSTIRKHWLMVLSISLLITGAMIVYVAQKPDYYKATARIQVNSENNPAAGSSSGAGGAIVVNNSGADPAYFTTQLQIIEGSGLLRRVAKTLDLENNQNFLYPQYGRQATVWQNVKRLFGLYKPPVPETAIKVINSPDNNKLDLNKDKSINPDAETEKYAPIVGMLKNNLTVMPVKDSRTSSRETRLIEIEYTHEDPAVAAKIVNAIGDAYVLQNLEQKIQTNASAGDFLQKRVAELQSEIRSGEERLINYSKDNQIISLDADQNTVVQRLTDLNLKLGQAENERIAAQTAYQAAVQNQMRAATAETKDPQVVALESKLNELRQTLAQLKTEYTDDWFQVVQTKKQIESVENQLLGLRKRASDIQIATLEEKLNETVAREKELRTNFAEQRGDVIKQNEAAINYKIIQQEIATNKTLLDGLLQRSRENDVILNGTPNNVLVVDRALVPRSPVGPERSKSIILAFIVSLMAGCGLAFVKDWLNDSVHNSKDIESILGLPLLGAIPESPKTLGSKIIPQALRQNHTGKSSYNLAIYEKPEYQEAYLQFSTCLTLSSAGGAPQTILITSGEQGEGKTLTALNLAASLAKTGGEILLIDADLRCPRIHGIKELNNDQGLTTLLTAKELTDELIEKVIQKDSIEHLHILTAGERTANPTNLLSSEELHILLEKLSSKYTQIIIDSPPVLYFADSTILATIVDSVIIVVRDNVSSKQTVAKAKKILQSVGARIGGMLMNGIPLHRTTYKQYENYNFDEGTPPNSGYQILKINN